MLCLGSPGAKSTNPDNPKAAGDSGGRWGSQGCEEGWAGMCLTIPVTCPASRSACAGMRPRAQGPRAGVGCCGSHGASAVSGRAGGWQGWCRPGSSSVSQELGQGAAELRAPRVPAASRELPHPRVMLQAVLQLQMLFLAYSTSNGVCWRAQLFQTAAFAVTSREMSPDTAGLSGHWQREQQVPGPGAAQKTGLAWTPHTVGRCFQS